MKGFREIKKKPRKIDIIKEQDAVIKLLAFERDYYKKKLVFWKKVWLNYKSS